MAITSTHSQNKTMTCYSVKAAVASAARKSFGCQSDSESEYDQRYPKSSLHHKIGALILISVAAISCSIFVSVLVIQLSRLEPKVPRFLVDSASFSKLNTTSSTLTATFLFSVRVINPNANHSVSYDRFYAAVFYGGASNPPLDVASVPSFHQEKLGESIVRFQLELVNEYVGEEVERGIISGAGAHGYVDFGFQVNTRAEFEKTGFATREYHLKLYCDPVRFGLSSHKGTWSMIGPSRECELD